MWSQASPVHDLTVRRLCCRPYAGHPRGCPNYNRRTSCPPHARTLKTVLDLSRPCYCLWNAFDLFAHVECMKARHPAWSTRQLYCCLYWQGTARAQLKQIVTEFVRTHPRTLIVACPEACGVNVTATMKALGVSLEWPPRKIAYQVALAGSMIQKECVL